MKTPICLLLAGVFLVAGCKRGKVPTAELEKAFQEPPTAAATPAAPPGVPPPNAFLQEAVTAMKTNGYVEALVPLQALRRHPGLNANQLTAVQDAMAAVQTELARRADQGDARAAQALQVLGAMRRNR